MADNLGQTPAIASSGLYATLIETVDNKALTGLVAGFTLMGQTPADGSIVGLMAQTGGTGNGTYLYTIDGANYTLTLETDLSVASTFKGQRTVQTGVSAASNSGTTYTWFITATGTVSFTALQTEGSNQVTKSYATAPLSIASNVTEVVTVSFAPDTWDSIVEKTLRPYTDGGATPSPLVVIVGDTTQSANELTGIRLSVTNAGNADLVGFVIRVGVTGVLA